MRKLLLLLSSSLLLLGLGPLLPHTNETCFAACIAELPVCRWLALVVCDLALLEGTLIADREGMGCALDLVLVSALTV